MGFVTARPLDAARDALNSLQGQLIAMLAAQNAVLAERVGGLEERLARLERAGCGSFGVDRVHRSGSRAAMALCSACPCPAARQAGAGPSTPGGPG
jgi:hypothetical protein